MAWTNVTTPTTPTWVNVQVDVSKTYDEATVSYDDSTVLYG